MLNVVVNCACVEVNCDDDDDDLTPHRIYRIIINRINQIN